MKIRVSRYIVNIG